MTAVRSTSSGPRHRPSLGMGALLLAVTLVSCGGERVYRSERFEPDSPFQRVFDTTVPAACGASRSALLSQGYRILESGETGVRAIKEFQPDEDVHNDLEITVTCERRGTRAIVYANAVQRRYVVKKSAQSASISLPRIGSLSLPGSSAAEDLVKTGGETVTDADFYDRFFALVARLLAPAAPPTR